MKKPRKPDKRDQFAWAAIAKQPTTQQYDSLMLALVPDLEDRPEYQTAMASTQAELWRQNGVEIHVIQAAIANNIIRMLRQPDVHDWIVAGDPFWLDCAKRVAASEKKWHQSGRIQLSVLRALTERYLTPALPADERKSLGKLIEQALLWKVDTGAGEEFRALTRIARAVASTSLIASLKNSARAAADRSVRINAQRMLDCISGKPYKRYYDQKFDTK